MGKLILRFDDYCALSDTAVERKFLEIVAACGGKAIMSVVPFVADTEWELRGPIPLCPLPQEKANLLKDFVPRHAEIALHGYSHQTVTRWSNLLEFGDRVTRRRQVERLRDGKAFLEDLFGVRVDTFVPPWNEYGLTTLEALEEAGLKILAGHLTLGPASGKLALVPACCELGQLENALAAGKSDADSIICLMLHEYDFAESGSIQSSMTLAGFESRLKGIGTENIQWASFGDCLAKGEWGVARLLVNRELRSALASPMHRLLHRGTAGVYWSTAKAKKTIALLNAGNYRKWLRHA